MCCWWFRVGPTLVRRTMAAKLEIQGLDPGHASAFRRIRHYPDINIYRLSDQKSCSVDGVNFWKPPNVYSKIVL